MVDFNPAVPTYSTDRNYKTITDFSKFSEVKENFLEDETMALIVKMLKSEEYTSYYNLCDSAAKVKAVVRVYADDVTTFTNACAKITDDFAVSIIGTGATAARDDAKNNWRMTFEGITAVNDPFTLLIDENYARLSGYHKESSLRAVETWADTIEVLSTDKN